MLAGLAGQPFGMLPQIAAPKRHSTLRGWRMTTPGMP
jgi:ribosome modulation factor